MVQKEGIIKGGMMHEDITKGRDGVKEWYYKREG